MVAPHPPHAPWVQESLPEGYLDKIPRAQDLFQPPNIPKENNPMKPEELRIYLAMAKISTKTWGARWITWMDQAGLPFLFHCR